MRWPSCVCRRCLPYQRSFYRYSKCTHDVGVREQGCGHDPDPAISNLFGLDHPTQRKALTVKALALINPGKPTGQILDCEPLKAICMFCSENRIVLLADEVYAAPRTKRGSVAKPPIRCMPIVFWRRLVFVWFT